MRLGAVVWDPISCRVENCECEVSRAEFRTQLPTKQQDSFVELYTVPMAIGTWSSLVAGRNSLAFADNNSALSALAKGCSPEVESALIIQEFWSACTKWRCGVWTDREESPANIADGPSRNEFASLYKPRSTQKSRPQATTRLSSAATATVGAGVDGAVADATGSTRPAHKKRCSASWSSRASCDSSAFTALMHGKALRSRSVVSCNLLDHVRSAQWTSAVRHMLSARLLSLWLLSSLLVGVCSVLSGYRFVACLSHRILVSVDVFVVAAFVNVPVAFAALSGEIWGSSLFAPGRPALLYRRVSLHPRPLYASSSLGRPAHRPHQYAAPAPSARSRSASLRARRLRPPFLERLV